MLHVAGCDGGEPGSDSVELCNKKLRISDVSHLEATKESQVSTLSKRQMKKWMKRKKWIENLPEKRARERRKQKMKKKEALEKKLKLGPSRKELKNSKMSKSKCKTRLVLDFSFDRYMTERELSKCVNQALRCYSTNRRSENPVQFYIVNFDGPSKVEMSKHNGYENWDVHFHEESYLDLFEKESIVYLTSDSENVIKYLEEEKVYVIGALVDHNSQKGLCHSIAVKQGIDHGCLPISEYLDMKTRKVLAVNHVFEIMVNVSNGMSWKDAFLETLPQRKGAVEKSSS